MIWYTISETQTLWHTTGKKTMKQPNSKNRLKTNKQTNIAWQYQSPPTFLCPPQTSPLFPNQCTPMDWAAFPFCTATDICCTKCWCAILSSVMYFTHRVISLNKLWAAFPNTLKVSTAISSSLSWWKETGWGHLSSVAAWEGACVGHSGPIALSIDNKKSRCCSSGCWTQKNNKGTCTCYHPITLFRLAPGDREPLLLLMSV